MADNIVTTNAIGSMAAGKNTPYEVERQRLYDIGLNHPDDNIMTEKLQDAYTLFKRLERMISTEKEIKIMLDEIHQYLNAFQLEPIPEKTETMKNEKVELVNIFTKCDEIAYLQFSNRDKISFILERLMKYL